MKFIPLGGPDDPCQIVSFFPAQHQTANTLEILLEERSSSLYFLMQGDAGLESFAYQWYEQFYRLIKKEEGFTASQS